MAEGTVGFGGSVSARVIRAPKVGLGWKVRNLPNVARGWRIPIAQALGIPTWYGKLEARLIRADGSTLDYGVLGYRQVTTAFVNFMVVQLQTETSVWGDFKFHDSGVGTTAENVTDTDIETTDGESRVTGSQEEGASANIYKSIGTIAYTTSKAITEHGLFSVVTGGTLMDRTLFSAINVENGDSINFGALAA